MHEKVIHAACWDINRAGAVCQADELRLCGFQTSNQPLKSHFQLLLLAQKVQNMVDGPGIVVSFSSVSYLSLGSFIPYARCARSLRVAIPYRDRLFLEFVAYSFLFSLISSRSLDRLWLSAYDLWLLLFSLLLSTFDRARIIFFVWYFNLLPRWSILFGQIYSCIFCNWYFSTSNFS